MITPGAYLGKLYKTEKNLGRTVLDLKPHCAIYGTIRHSVGNQLLNLSHVNLSTGSLMPPFDSTNQNSVFYNKRHENFGSPMENELIIYLLCTITLENYDLHSRNNYHLFNFLKAATTAT